MKIVPFCTLAAALCFVSCKQQGSTPGTSAAAATDTFVLAKEKHQLAAGTKIESVKKMSMGNAELRIQMQGQEIKGTATMSQKEESKTEYLPGNQIRETQTSHEEKSTMLLNGQEAPSPATPTPLLNIPVLLKQVEGKWVASLEKGDIPTPEQKEKLVAHEKSQTKDADFRIYGSTPRKVGETWTVDAAEAIFGDDAEDGKGEVTLTFKGVETVDGKKCARLEGPAKFSGKNKKEGVEQDMTFDGNFVVFRSLDDMVDIKNEFKGKMTMKMGLPGDGVMNMTGDMTMEETSKISR